MIGHEQGLGVVRQVDCRDGGRLGFFLVPLGAILLSLAEASAGTVTVVPPGNQNPEQPEVPGASARRTEALKTSYDAKYQRVYDLLRRDGKLREKIVETAALYEIDPLHIVGAIVGEHTYNVDAYDRLQAYYVKAISYVNSSFSFSYDGESIGSFIERPEFRDCAESLGSYDRWICREAVWEQHFRGQEVGGKQFPDDRFSAVFFQPFYAGQTFGLGQLNPLTALQMTDIVASISGQQRLSHANPQEVYRTIMDPDLTLPYIAATLKKGIDTYREIAGFDISDNPGITATLYNLGNPEARARTLANENEVRKARGEAVRLPRENYYGWLVNARLDELSALFAAAEVKKR